MKFQFENPAADVHYGRPWPLCMDRCFGNSGDDGLVDYQTLSRPQSRT